VGREAHAVAVERRAMTATGSDLFDQAPHDPAGLPLATRLRPRTLDEYAGQSHVLGPGSPLRKALQEGRLGSLILWAPPGCGKTTLAHLIAGAAGAHVESLSAVAAGVADVRRVAQAAVERRRLHGRPTLLILDEIHHFNRSQQDSLLGYLEDGTLTLVGATTENPFVTLAPALLSRARVIPLRPLTPVDLEGLIERALRVDRELSPRNLALEPEARDHLVRSADGDARLALNALESAALMTPDGDPITLAAVEAVLQRPAIRYDRKGDYHFDSISAFIKSVRGSDSDAALHYLARMLEAGEDPRFIVRRLLILASEDVGNAEPQGLVVASAAAQAVAMLGMPEARIVLAQATTFLAEAPKSNRAYLGINRAMADLKDRPWPPVPLPLRNAPTEGLKKLGHGQGYQNPHDAPGGWVNFDYLPPGFASQPYYEPTDRGYERRMQERRERQQPPTPCE